MPAKKKAAKPKKGAGLVKKSMSVKLPTEVIKACAELVPQSVHDAHKQAIKDIKDGKGGSYEKLVTPKQVQSVLMNIARGLPPESAAILAGLNKKTYYEWKNRFDGLSDAVTHAQTLLEHDLIETVQRAMLEKPEVALKVLERRFSHNWAEKKDLNVSGNVTHQGWEPDKVHQLSQWRREQDIIDAETVEPKQLPTTIDDQTSVELPETLENTSGDEKEQ